ncbi:MAG: hypothetical protein QM756_15840 [Polyangiaceae bacterium]
MASGWVVGTARPAHLGRTTQIWEVRIVDGREQDHWCASRASRWRC